MRSLAVGFWAEQARRTLHAVASGDIHEGTIEAGTMPCGMCGLSDRDGCALGVEVNTKQAKRPGAEPVMYVKMNGVCKGYTSTMRGNAGKTGKIHWKARHKASTAQPCANVPGVCKVCSSRARQQVWVWKYHLKAHSESEYDRISIPPGPEALINDDERLKVKQLKNKHEAMQHLGVKSFCPISPIVPLADTQSLLT